MKRVAILAVLLFAAGCSDSSDSASTPAPEAAAPAAATEPTPAEILAGGAANTIGPEGATGCRDKIKAAALVEAGKKEDQSEYIKLWAEGMQDETCRGFVAGLGVSVQTANEDGWDCILPIDDPENKVCFWIPAGLVK